MRRLLVMMAVLVAQSIPSVAESREKDLDRWVDRDLIPYVSQQLIVHPRFKNETVMFVVLHDNAPASASNALALSIRDRLLAAAVATPGIEIGWQHGRNGMSPDSSPQECAQDDVHYYIGVELDQKLDSSYSVSVRALDLEDRNWVTGFGRHWQGQLSTSQRQAMRQSRVDETFLGGRDVPFTLAQTDLLAAHLAHKLSCELLRGVEQDYIVATDSYGHPVTTLAATVELVGNNLVSRQALRLAPDETGANVVMSGKAHRIDGDLYQYWVTLTPVGGNDNVSALGASAYIVLPATPDVDLPQGGTATPPVVAASDTTSPTVPVTIPNAGKEAFLSALRIAPPRSLADCSRRSCSLLQAEARADSIVFFLEHQANHGLVRLAGPECRGRTSAHIARRGELLSFPIARTTTSPQNWNPVDDWQLAPGIDTYYAVAITDARLARRLANHLDRLPVRCGNALRPGLEGDALRDWLGDFAMLTARDAAYVDWRAVEVRDML